MNYVRYRLQPYSGPQSRFRCPACKHRHKTFKRYIHPHTGSYLAEHVGLCDRILKCGYHVTPRQYFAATGNAHKQKLERQPGKHRKPQKTEQTSFIDVSTVNESLDNYENNNLVLYLIDKLGVEAADAMVKRYLIGTHKRWPGATVFWQIDADGKVRTGKIMLYNRQTGKRVKKPYNHITWVHNQTGGNNFNLKQCLFGEHLLNSWPDMPIALVESEKTAIIAAAFMPAFLWLATGGLEGLNAGACQVLKSRRVMLFPDANGYNKWRKKVTAIQEDIKGMIVKVSTVWEAATDEEKLQGVDLVDVLLKQPV